MFKQTVKYETNYFSVYGKKYEMQNQLFYSIRTDIKCAKPAAPQCKNTLRKHAYSNILKISPPKKANFHIKNSDILHISAQNIDCGYSLEPPRRGGSNYPQSMFLS